jgi:GrpB-like predicted nucleotidyltransferase (UPF0157 family)
MLTAEQEKYLLTIPPEKIARVRPFDPKVQEAAREIIEQIKKALPELTVLFMGASALGIAGQNDIDLNILSHPSEYAGHLPILEELFNKPANSSSKLVKWEFARDGFEVELYLTDRDSASLRTQIRTFELLRDNSALAREYEHLKLACDGVAFREYMRKKYEFFNRILDIKS